MSQALDVSVGWIDDHSDLLLPDPRNATFDRVLLQRAGEFALLYRALSRAAVPAPCLAQWRAMLEQYVRSEELIEAARKSLKGSWAWLMPYFVLQQTDQVSVEEHDDTMRYALESGLPLSGEVVPYRKFDQHYFLSMFQQQAIEFPSLLEGTYFFRCRNMLWVDRDDAYSLTHTIFYLNDFGEKSIQPTNPGHSKAQEMISSLLPHFVKNGDWDVAGELLIAGLSIEGKWRSSIEPYLYEFRRQRGAAGFTPPSRATQNALTDSHTREEIFEACIHTTLVAVLVEIAAGHAPERDRVPDFVVQQLCVDHEETLAGRLFSARNRAVMYLNDQNLEGHAIPSLSRLPGEMLAIPTTKVGMLNLDRDAILALLAGKPPDILFQCLLELAECFARAGDIEVVLRLIQVSVGRCGDNSRFRAVLHYLLQTQKANGSIGQFLHESRLLGASNLGSLRNALTDLFVEAIDPWLDTHEMAAE